MLYVECCTKTVVTGSLFLCVTLKTVATFVPDVCLKNLHS